MSITDLMERRALERTLKNKTVTELKERVAKSGSDLAIVTDTDVVDVRELDDVTLLAGERKQGESVRAMLACNDYLRQGPLRSIAALIRRYKEAREGGLENTVASVGQYYLYKWYKDYEWERRAESYDANFDNEKSEVALSVLSHGLSLPFRRVEKLKALAERLEMDIDDEDKLYPRDVKQIGTGKYAKKIELRRFNSNLVEQYRGVLDDLAKETGGRVTKVDQRTQDESLVFVVTRDADQNDQGVTIDV